MDHGNVKRGRKGLWEKSQSLSNPLERPRVRGSLRDFCSILLLLFFFFGQTSCDLVRWLTKKFQFQELWNFWVIIREEKTNHSEAQCQSARLARRGSLHGLFQEFRWWRVSDEQPPHNIMNDDSYYHSCCVGMSAQSEKRIGLDDEPSISAAKQLDSPKRKCQRNQQRCENIFLILQ